MANTIAAQIGKRAFFMMGARDLLGSANALAFKIGRNAKSVSHVTITLQPDDTYTVVFHRVRGASVKVVSEQDDVYADCLHRVIESGTGLYLSL